MLLLHEAARPATCGDAIDVPDMVVPWSPVPAAVEKIPTPGAVTSGLSQLSLLRGPLELNDAKSEKLGLGTKPEKVIVVMTPAFASNVASVLCSAPRNGVETPGIGPSNGG